MNRQKACLLLLLTLPTITLAELGTASDKFAQEMHAGMLAMQKAMAGSMSGDPDLDFLTMMIPHHEGAIEMARLELIYGNDPLVRRLAEEIIASQQTEIAAMRQRLKLLRERKGGGSDEFPSLGGTRGKD